MLSYLVTSGRILSNCWESLKAIKLQHDDEICVSVIVTKVEKIDCITYGEKKHKMCPKCLKNGLSAAKPRIEERSTTIPRWE